METWYLTVQPKAIEGVRFLNQNSFRVTVNIKQMQSKKEFYDIPVAVLNKPKGFGVSVEPKTVDATVFRRRQRYRTID